MRLIDRYICREVFTHALLGLLIFTFVLFVPQLAHLMGFLVRHSVSPGRLGVLFLGTLPGVLTYTTPMAVLVGVLIGLGRLSADSELIAMSALGMGIRRVLIPVGVLASVACLMTLAITLWAGPAAQRSFRQVQDELAASQASFEIQPRVFDERTKHMVLYVEDVTAAATRWRGVFLAETGSNKSLSLTLAEDAIVVGGREPGKLELHLRSGSTHEFLSSDPDHYLVTTFGQTDWPIEVSGLNSNRNSAPTNAERSLEELYAATGGGVREAHVEIQRRFAFPVACLVFALLAVPLAARPRRGGRAMGFLVSLILVCGYYLLFVIGAGLAHQGKVSPGLGVWAANLLTGIAAITLLPGMEHIRGVTWLSALMDQVAVKFKDLGARLRREEKPGRPEPVRDGANMSRRRTDAAPASVESTRVVRLRPLNPPLVRARHRSGFPQMIDLFLLKNFMSYFLLVMAGFIFLFEVFTIFELLDDIARTHAPFLVVLKYLWYLVPYWTYKLAPFAVLVAAMITLGVMSKNNEIVAIKASGVSLFRLAWPLIGASAALALGLLALDNSYLPYFNQRQDALRNEIKGRPPQTYFNPNQSWIYGLNDKIYNYQLFDPDRSFFGGLNVFELDAETFRLRRRVYASRAIWSPEQGTWLLEGGWVRDFDGANIVRYTPFKAYMLSELTEPPGYFHREVRQSYQMNLREMAVYIGELKRAGYDVSRLSVQWHEKLAFPLIAPIITMLAIPFAFLVGTRGAVGGLALGVGIGIVYWATSALFEAIGGVGQLPPLLAGWAPDIIFIFLGAFFMLRMKT